MLLKSEHLVLMVKGHDFSRTFVKMLPISAAKLGSQGISSYCSFMNWVCAWIHPPALLRSCHLLSAKVCRYRINTSFVHDVLIDLNGIPIVEIISRPTSWETHISTISYQIVRKNVRLFSWVMDLSALLRGVSFFGHGSWCSNGCLTMGRRIVLRGHDSFFQGLIFASNFKNLHIFLIISLVRLLQFLSQLFVAFEELTDHIDTFHQSFRKDLTTIIHISLTATSSHLRTHQSRLLNHFSLLLWHARQHLDMLVSSAEFLSESFDLFLQLVDRFISWIIIDDRLICDIWSPGCIGESWDILVKEHIVRTDTGNHQTVAVSSDWLF